MNPSALRNPTAIPQFEWAIDPKPRTFRVVALASTFVLFFSVGRYIPGFSWSLELGIALSLCLAVVSIVGTRVKARDPLNVYLMLAAFALPVMGSISAYLVFEQPVWLGLAAQRGCLLVLFAYAMSNFLENGVFTAAEVRRALVVLAWLNLAVCAPVLMFLDPNDYSDLGSLVSDGGGVFNLFHLPMTFIIFGALYFFGKWILSGRVIYGLLAAPFMLYIFGGNSGRVLNLALLLALVMIAWVGHPGRRFSNIFATVALALVTLVLSEIIVPGKASSMLEGYLDAFSAISGAYGVADISANARILQSEIAWPYVRGNWLIGTGSISNQWNGGYAALFGYFHPSDLGLLGLTFTYGVVGLAFFGFQYLILIRGLPSVLYLVQRVPDGDYLLAITAMLVFLLFSSFSTGVFILTPEQTLLFFVLLRSRVRQCHYVRWIHR